MRSVENIQYQEVSIIYTNASGMGTEEALALFKSTVNIVNKMPEKSVLSLVNLKDVDLSRSFNAQLKGITEQNSPYIKATAIYGLSAMASFIAKSIIKFTKRNARFFDDIEEAKAWLLKENN